ncbi:glycosyltransferase family 39 protein [Streptomyces acidiscabies]|uniref:Membrane protein n=1 Tax=Streptomyces acidiscabies TaxID=42234 RepID=A0A0L0KAL7_9ACTN|nr:glycosyltransferase family 39 protein [Streptomyces acidiscabies]KND34690.1 membrane protein [Streptomyces acidiscabies]
MSVLAPAKPVSPLVRPRPPAWPIALAPSALALALGLWGIRRQNTLWGDEAVTYDLAHRDLSQIWATAQHIDLVHALYYAVMHAVFTVLGDGLLTLRLPSALAMSAAAAGVTVLGLRLAGPRAGLLAGLAFAVLPQVQKYAQEGRSYAMVCALVTWATYALVTPTRWRWPIYGSTMLLACLLHEFAALALAAHGVTLLVARSRALRAWAATAGFVVAGLLPLAIRSAGQSSQLAWIESPVRLPGVLLMTGLALACAVTPLRRRGPVHLKALAVPLAVLPTLLLLLASLIKPVFVDRYVLFSSTGTALLLGACLDHTLRRTPLITGVATLTALLALTPASLALRTPESRTNNATAITTAVQETAHPTDGLLYLPSQSRTLTTPLPMDLALARTPKASNTLTGIEFPAQDIPTRMLRFARLIVIHTGSPTTPQDEAKTTTLRDHFRQHESTQVNGARITVYERR